MKKSIELHNPQSCLNRAEEDEPLFVLRANDPLMPVVVRAWADRYLASKKNPTLEQVAKYNQALQAANDAELWKNIQQSNTQT